MNAKQRVRLALAGQKTDRALFCPAIYEHKARLIKKSPSKVSQNAQLLTEAVFAEYEIYKPDMLTVGIDVYNIEVEALGSSILFPQAVDAVPVIEKKVLGSMDDFDSLGNIEPEKSGRMPLVLEAANRANSKLGDELFIRGAISGPFSIAAGLLGMESLITAMFDQPDKVDKLMNFCTEVASSYGRAFIQRGVQVCIFDSYAAPPLVSPALYKNLVLPCVSKLAANLKRYGVELLEYVVGGQTNPVAKRFFATGANIVLSDFPSDVNIFLKYAGGTDILIRRNISPVLIEQGPEKDLRAQVKNVLMLAANHRNVIIGTGVLSYNTDIERVLAVKQMCLGKID